MPHPARPLRCRPIAEADLPAVVALLEQGFPDRPHRYWSQALDVLREREALADYPRYGLLLETGGACVGVLLLIYARLGEGEGAGVRCNLSSWYVSPPYRAYAPLLVSRALRHDEVTYVNVSPARHTWPILQAQGYRRYSGASWRRCRSCPCAVSACGCGAIGPGSRGSRLTGARCSTRTWRWG